MKKSMILLAATLGALAVHTQAVAEGTVKIGLVVPLTGPFTSTGQEILGAAKLYIAQHGDTVAGKKIELLVRDDAGAADATRRLATELIVTDKVAIVAGMGLTPLALAVAQVATKSHVPEIVLGAATSSIPAASPYIVRTSFASPMTINLQSSI